MKPDIGAKKARRPRALTGTMKVSNHNASLLGKIATSIKQDFAPELKALGITHLGRNDAISAMIYLVGDQLGLSKRQAAKDNRYASLIAELKKKKVIALPA
jgi:methylmalonyl-CoA mutase cobalamin-binding subunit